MMKNIGNTNYTISQLKALLMWALLPIVCFALAIPMPKWYTSLVDTNTGTLNEKIAWGRILLSSPDVVLQSVDSIPYFNGALRDSYKKSGAMCADITHLFPDYNAKKLTLLDVPSAIEAQPTIAVWENNGSFFYAHLTRSKDGDFYLLVKNNGHEKAINLGQFVGKLNVVSKHTIDLASTTLNVVAIVALLLCIIGFGLMLSTDPAKRTRDTYYLFWAVYISTFLLLLHFGFWLFDGPTFFGNHYDYPEWITVAWLLSEIGLLGGVLLKMKVDSNHYKIHQNAEKE